MEPALILDHPTRGDSEHDLRSHADAARRLKSAPFIAQVRWEFFSAFGLVPRRPCVDSSGVTIGGLRFEYGKTWFSTRWVLLRYCKCKRAYRDAIADQVELSLALDREPKCWRCWMRSKLRVTLRREVQA